MTTERHILVASNIIQQMGGFGRLKAMIGMRQPLAYSGLGGVSFCFPNKASGRPNRVCIKLNGLDLYDVEFKRVYGSKVTTTASHENVYASSLREVFEMATGLALSL